MQIQNAIALKHYAEQNKLSVQLNPPKYVLSNDYACENDHDIIDDPNIESVKINDEIFVTISGGKRQFHHFWQGSDTWFNNKFKTEDIDKIIHGYEDIDPEEVKIVDEVIPQFKKFFKALINFQNPFKKEFHKTGYSYVILDYSGYYLSKDRKDFSITIPLKDCTFFGTNINKVLNYLNSI